ncbi:unnamed protein product [Rotaria sordida]|uniref:Uncharacterized protein n=1 Tax=Rotaria sordida TaxID=392033 RepID=A0A815NM17_9BILA|nr:unnamed protein product [Rotaria sordida]
MYDDEEYLLNKDQEPVIRQHTDHEKIKHFVSWLAESNTLVPGTYDLTTLRMDNEENICLYHLSDDDDNQLSEDAINYAVPFITVPDDDSKGLVLARNKAIGFDEESIDNMSM